MANSDAHIVAMTGSYFRGDSVPVLMPEDEARFETVTYTYYEQLNGYQHLKTLDIGYFFYSGSYADEILKVLDTDGDGAISYAEYRSFFALLDPEDLLRSLDESSAFGDLPATMMADLFKPTTNVSFIAGASMNGVGAGRDARARRTSARKS